MANKSPREPWNPPKAYRNVDFLTGPDGRNIRVLCEFTEPQARFRRLRVKNTVVMFGSARTKPMDEAKQDVAELRAQTRGKKRVPRSVQEGLALAKREMHMAKYYEDAREIAAMITNWSKTIKKPSDRFYVCSGGGPGIMEAANRGADEAGGRSIGLNISLPFEQHPNTYQSKELSFEFHYFFVRKFWFFYLAKALVVFPGGFGTMDEMFELLTLVQTEKTKKYMPIVIYGSKFWKEVIDFKALAKWGVISPDDLDLFKFCDEPEEAFTYLRDALTEHYV